MYINNPIELIDRLKQERGYSWRTLQQASGLSKVTLVNIHSGKSAGSAESVRRLQLLYYQNAPKGAELATSSAAMRVYAPEPERPQKPDVSPELGIYDRRGGHLIPWKDNVKVPRTNEVSAQINRAALSGDLDNIPFGMRRKLDMREYRKEEAERNNPKFSKAVQTVQGSGYAVVESQPPQKRKPAIKQVQKRKPATKQVQKRKPATKQVARASSPDFSMGLMHYLGTLLWGEQKPTEPVQIKQYFMHPEPQPQAPGVPGVELAGGMVRVSEGYQFVPPGIRQGAGQRNGNELASMNNRTNSQAQRPNAPGPVVGREQLPGLTMGFKRH